MAIIMIVRNNFRGDYQHKNLITNKFLLYFSRKIQQIQIKKDTLIYARESNHNCIHRRERIIYNEPRGTFAAGNGAARESLRDFGNADRTRCDGGADDV